MFLFRVRNGCPSAFAHFCRIAFFSFFSCRMFTFLLSSFSRSRLFKDASLKLVSLYQQEWSKWPGATSSASGTCLSGLQTRNNGCGQYAKPPRRRAAHARDWSNRGTGDGLGVGNVRCAPLPLYVRALFVQRLRRTRRSTSVAGWATVS